MRCRRQRPPLPLLAYLCGMNPKKVRVRFAPSPTGGLHLGGVRTVLYNYLFARQHGGDFILRIEDTDQTRFVHGAEQYIMDCLRWCGLQPDESPEAGGPVGPYRQSERKAIYRQYAEQLVVYGYAYYAFDTSAELEDMRDRHRTESNPSPQYDSRVRMSMCNSLTLTSEEVAKRLADGIPHVIRIRMPEDETIEFEDMIRGSVQFQTGTVDDKVLLKADGMPTYHLAVVVDDYLMGITHAFRGEEWLPSAPVHLLLWKYLGWVAQMPQWAHLPLILKPDGHGKLSKRDGDRLGFPVFAMNWKDPKSDELTRGFREMGFMPEAVVNLHALLGWNDGSGREIMSIDELCSGFSMDRIHKGGAKFDFEKAKWFNQEWIKRSETERLLPDVAACLEAAGIQANIDILKQVIPMVKERCTLMTDFVEQTGYFFKAPVQWDLESVRPKWTPEKQAWFTQWASGLISLPAWDTPTIEADFKQAAAAGGIKPGELQLPLRVMLVGGKFGPPVFEIAAMIGQEETTSRIRRMLSALNSTD
jgi:glutamyl-tRNA synthetase